MLVIRICDCVSGVRSGLGGSLFGISALASCKRCGPNSQEICEAQFAEQFGSFFAIDEMEDLELLTDLLDMSGKYLDVIFAVASYVQRVPDGMSRLTPAVIERLSRSKALCC